MRSITSRGVAIVALALVLAATPLAAEDLTLVTRVSGTQVEPTTATQYVTTGKVRSSDGATDVVIHYDGGRIVTIDNKKKQYSETTLEEMRATFAELEQAVAANPMLGKMLGGGDAEATVETTGKTREIAGYEAHEYVVRVGDSMSMTVWAAPGLEAPVSYLDARKMVYAGMGPIGSRFADMFDALEAVEGYPLATSLHAKVMGMDVDSESEAIEVRQGPVDPAVFEPPAGYKKVKSPYGG